MKLLHRKALRFIFLLALGGLPACTFSLAGDVTPPPDFANPPALATQPPAGEDRTGEILPAAAFDLANGQSLYVEKCAPCHGLRGDGKGPQAAALPSLPSALGDETIADLAAPQHWFEIVSNGNLEKYMPPFASLSVQERWDVVFYALSLSTPPETLQTGKAVYEQACVECHGEQGAGGGVDFRDLAAWGNRPLQAVQAVIANGSPPDMPAFSGSLQPGEIRAAAAYLRSFSQTGQSGEAQSASAPEETTGNAAPATPGKVVVTGKVVHAGGGQLPAGLKVILQLYENMQPVMNLETETGADGSFTFPEVERVDGQFYVVSAVYQDFQFFSDVVPATDVPQGSSLSLPVTVYDASMDTSTLLVERAHIFLNFENPGMLQVVEMLNIRNPHPQVIVAAEEGQPVLSFQLPNGAVNLQFQDGTLGERYLQTENGFADTSSIPPAPNPHQILFAYEVPYNNNKAVLQIALPLPVQSLLIAAPVSGVRVKGDLLTSGGQRDVQGMQIQLYQANNLAANQPFDLTVSGWPASGAGILPGSTGGLLFGAGVFILALAAAGIFFFRYQHGRRLATPQEDTPPPEEESSEALLEAILALEDRHRAGELSEEVFQRRRTDLKDRLQAALKDAGENADAVDD
ncbi:MAG: c-type cytochrome [Anaerolineaceae bacterium]|nr:c-type cytochrome [Anaerolineaceae bacterium]